MKLQPEPNAIWNHLAVPPSNAEPENNSFVLHPAAELHRLTRNPNGSDCRDNSSHSTCKHRVLFLSGRRAVVKFYLFLAVHIFLTDTGFLNMCGFPKPSVFIEHKCESVM